MCLKDRALRNKAFGCSVKIRIMVIGVCGVVKLRHRSVWHKREHLSGKVWVSSAVSAGCQNERDRERFSCKGVYLSGVAYSHLNLGAP